MSKRIYVAATSQHVGKTTCTLGIYSVLRERGYNVGYCKPVGQEFVDLGELKVDKDALLFSKMMGFELQADLHSPVIIGSGVTTAYLENPTKFNFKEKILHAAAVLDEKHDVVVYEGTGHPGVGSVVDLSNADVAKALGAEVIMVVEGGVGSTIDELNVKLALFRELNVPIHGVIINKVLTEKMDKVRTLVSKKLDRWGIPLLGVLPYDKVLTHPIMETIRQAVKGRTVFNEEYLDNWVENIVSGALVERREVEHFERLLLIVSCNRLNRVLEVLEELTAERHIEGSPLAGIIINGVADFVPDFLQNFNRQDYIDKYKIPVISTTLDTYGAALKISRIAVKIHLRTLWKAERAIKMMREHVDLSGVV
ncbi:MAG: AAA family ATPase [Saprospiraceae bacterium]